METIAAIDLLEGQGTRTKRLFPVHDLRHDPFVLLDEFFLDPLAGFPPHPHRGFEVVTFMIDGGMRHEDDIGNTVAKGVESVAQTGATFLTVHAYPQTMKAAMEAKRGSKLKILAVTVLTSYDDADLFSAGYKLGVSALVAQRAGQARDLKVDGLVCSAEEASNLRKIVGPGLSLVTPGIRPAGSAKDDQKRIMTPAKAISAGADYLVVGRPIVESPDPKAAADAIVAEIKNAKSA